MIADIIAKFACVSVNSSSSGDVTGNLWKNKSNMVVKQTQRLNDKSNHDGSGGVADGEVMISIAMVTLMTTMVMTMIMRLMMMYPAPQTKLNSG